jgi:hypothetical protein
MDLRSAVFPLVMAACASEAGVPMPGTATDPVPASLPAVVPMEQFFEVSRSIECAEYFRCAARNNNAEIRAVFGTYDRCVALVRDLASEASRVRSARLTAMGVVRYDGTAARRCLEAQRAPRCGERPPQACDAVFQGTAPIGGMCTHAEQCAGDAACVTFDDRMPRCPGVCVARVAIGEPCMGAAPICSNAAGPASCNYEQELATTPNPYRCRALVDTPTVGAGEVCVDFSVPRFMERRCPSGMECRDSQRDGGSSTQRTCQGPAAPGERCETLCTGNAVCDLDQIRFTRRCLAFEVRDREGETCIQGNGGSESCNVTRGLNCVQGRCRRVGDGAEGSVCFTNRFGLSNCRSGLWCHTATMTCRPRLADGMPCRNPNECESRACVPDRMTGTTRCGLSPIC